MRFELILQKITDYQQKLPEHCIVSKPLRLLQESLKAISEPENNFCIYEEIEETWLAIEEILENLRTNEPSPFTFHRTKIKSTYEQRVAELMAIEQNYQEKKKLCESTLDFLKSLEKEVSPSKKEKVTPNLDRGKAESVVKEKKKVDAALLKETTEWLKKYTFLSSANSLPKISQQPKHAPVQITYSSDSASPSPIISESEAPPKPKSAKLQENRLENGQRRGFKTR